NATARRRSHRARRQHLSSRHGDSQLKLSERFADAHRLGELRDYLLEFVGSLKTRTSRTTS
ncbi:MAG: hypothetical protein M3123_05765, partial [Actinomycetota bacterium]|nr:hypothetical protein [Actinomycetota bacterium]